MVDVGVDEKALTHLLEKVLVADAHAPVTLALEKAGVRTASDLVSLQLDPDVPLKYDKPAEGGDKVKKNIPLLQAEMRKIMGIQEYIRYHSKNVSLKHYESLADWEELTAKNFIFFRINIAPTLPPDVTPSTVTAQPTPAITDPLSDWKKGVKRDMSIFRELKKVKEWEQWDTQFRADVATQGVSRVLDRNFQPQTYDDKVLFREQQQYLYAVFVRILRTDKSKAIVRKYKSTFDAQSIYRELQEYATNSTQAVLDSNTLLQYITTARIDDGTWNSTTEKFVLHWMEQVRLYEELVDPTAALVDAVKLTLITNAVRGHPKLSGVYNVAVQLASQTGQRVDYEQYSDLLLSECAQADAAFAQSPRKAHHNVYMSALAINDGEDDALFFSADEADYNIDSDPMTLMANAHRHRELSANRVLMQSEQWKRVSPDGQKIWDQLSDADKAVILKRPAANLSRPNRPSNEHKPDGQKVNVHDTTVYDFITANAHLLDYGEAPDDTGGGASDEEAQTLHAFLASRGNNSSPADIRNLLSTSSKRAPNKLPKDRQASAHVTYSVDKHHMDTPGSLIDRGANGGVAGADVRVIASTRRAVNVQGISEHQVTDLKIVTAGGVVQTQRGPVIAILNQYAHIGTGKTIHSSVQLEEFGLEVNEKSVRVPGGLQHIKTPDGYVLPIQIKDGLPYVALRPYTDDEWETLPHIHWTRDSDWDPAVFDGGTDVDVCTRHPRQIEMDESRLHFQARQVKPGEQDWETLRRFFGWGNAYGVS